MTLYRESITCWRGPEGREETGGRVDLSPANHELGGGADTR